MDEWLKIARELGFPVAVTIYLLVRFDRLLGELRDVIRDLVHEIRKQREKE